MRKVLITGANKSLGFETARQLLQAAVYQPSKAELNMYTINLAYELRDTPFKVNAVDPGFAATDFNNHRGARDTKQAGTRIARYALIGEDGPTGKYISEEQNPETGEIPW
jgi:NAD(P)-dependent dehydrogenase (short-subunit alcohol dehydrogenase family)